MEKFGLPKRKGLWEAHGENAQEAVEASTLGLRADELLAGQSWSIAPEPKIVRSESDSRQIDPMELSSTQNNVAETLLGQIDLTVAPKEMSFGKDRSFFDQTPVDPMELTPQRRQKAETILTNYSLDNSALVPNKRLTEIETKQSLQQTNYDTFPRVPFANNGYDRIGKNSLTPNPIRNTTPAPTLFSKIKKLFG